MEKHYDFKIEKEIQGFWQEEKIYKFNQSETEKVYSIDTPPPTVSGKLHIGHLFSYTQAEIIARYKRMRGYNVFYPMGFDNNGLPTERLVEKDENINIREAGRSEFKEKCIKVSGKYIDEYKEFFKMLGFSVDWDLQYETISDEVKRLSQKMFIELVKEKRAYLKESPVLWCTKCQTSIAQAELDVEDKESEFVYLQFKCEGESLYVATTRPELLYGCACLFFNPKDERYKKLLNKKALVPLYNYEIPVLQNDEVEIDKGTGLVMCASYGDTSDVSWFEKYNLSYRKVINEDGRIDDSVPFIGGLKVLKARDKITDLLNEEGVLLKTEKIMHKVGVHERCQNDIEIIRSKQWYIDILSQKEQLLELADEINWHPKQMKNKYIAWVNNLKWDWCISRQRYFGVEIPVWYCKNCNKIYLADETQLPIDPSETMYKGVCGCGCNEFVGESAVMDTWATSSLTPQINQKHGVDIPMSMRTHAHEIIRTWSFYTIARSYYHNKKIPFSDLMINGYVMLKKGEKISKSKSNNALEPAMLINEHSADALRYWSANAKLGTDTFFEISDLSVAKRFITKLYNAYKFVCMHLSDFDKCSRPKLLAVDKWMIERTNETVDKTKRLLDEYEIGLARHEIDELFWKDFCDNYIELVKNRLYKPEIYGYEERKSAQYALYYSFLEILKMYAIYVPHITEYLYREFFIRFEGVKSIYLLKWEDIRDIDYDILNFGKLLKDNVASIRRVKTQNNLSNKDLLESVNIEAGEFTELFKQVGEDIKACFNIKDVIF